MRVLLVNASYHGGGAERAARELLHGLTDAGHEVHMLVGSSRGGPANQVTTVRSAGERYLKAVEKLGLRADWRHFGSRSHFAKVTADRWDVVHLHNLHGGWCSLAAARRLAERMPTVWTLHDEWAINGGVPYDMSRAIPIQRIDEMFPNHPAMLYRQRADAKALAAFINKRLPVPDAIITPSRWLASLVPENPQFAGAIVEAIPNGVTLLDNEARHADRAEARRAFGLAAAKPVVMYIAANFDSPYKGARCAVEALQRLDADACQALVLGRNPDAITAAIPQRAVCPGFISDERQLALAYRATDVVLLPSLADNLPYTALEAMACGRPFVGFAVGGLVEMAGDGERGRLAPVLDVTRLANTLRDLLADTDATERLGANGRAWVERRCAMPTFLRSVTDVYHRLGRA